MIGISGTLDNISSYTAPFKRVLKALLLFPVRILLLKSADASSTRKYTLLHHIAEVIITDTGPLTKCDAWLQPKHSIVSLQYQLIPSQTFTVQLLFEVYCTGILLEMARNSMTADDESSLDFIMADF